MEDDALPRWESKLVDDAIRRAEQRLRAESATPGKRALQLAREQGYHRLAVAIDRPAPRSHGSGQLSFFPQDPTLFDETA